ncbi:MAG: MoaD/ThiS family protein [Desulfuromonas sp.]|nr:MoaD/ThiS family protein [Desulfuromonas sp.]
MIITVKLIGVFRIDRFKEQRQPLAEGSCVADIVDSLELSRRLLGIMLINGVHATESELLNDGDCLTLMPVLEGG